MSGSNVNGKKLSLKLMVNTKTNKIVFAEADSAFVDFIFHLLSLPLAKVADLLKDKGMNGCLVSVFKCFRSLDSKYFDPNLKKDTVFRPNYDAVVPMLSLNYDAPFPSIYMCPTHNQFRLSSIATCTTPGCRELMGSSGFAKVKDVLLSNKSQGFMKPGVLEHYMVMDDLEVKPMTVAFFKNNAIDFEKLEEKVVQVGLKEAIEILKASLQTDAVLTTVFLGNANQYRKRVAPS